VINEVQLAGVRREMDGAVNDALLEHGPALRAAGSLHRRMKACVCPKPECRAFRERHNFGDAVVAVTKAWPEDRQRRHFAALGHDEPGVVALLEKVAAGKDVRIALWHYYQEDRQQRRGRWIIHELTANPRQKLLGRHREKNTPLPNRSLLANGDGDGGGDSPNFAEHPDWQPLGGSTGPIAAAPASERTARRQARVSAAIPQPPQLRRTPEKPLPRNEVAAKLSPEDKRRRAPGGAWWGLTNQVQIRLLIDIITEHYTQDAQHGGCVGRRSEELRADGSARYSSNPLITFRPTWDSTHATCLCINGECTSCGKTFRWDSQPRSEATGNFMGNDLIGAAVATTPVTVAHAQYFLAVLMMQPPSAKTIRDFLYTHAAPTLHNMWRLEQEKIFKEIRYKDSTARRPGRTVIAEYDMSHSCVRSAENSTACVIDAESGLVIWKMVLDEGEAAGREAIACREALQFFERSGIDIGAMVIDDSSCRTIIEAAQRSQAGSESEKKRFIKVLLDVWHSKKNGKPEYDKYVRGEGCFGAIQAAVRKAAALCAQQGRVLTEAGLGEVLQLIMDRQEMAFKEDFKGYFDAIEDMSAEVRGSWEAMKDDPAQHSEALKAMMADEASELQNVHMRDNLTAEQDEALCVEINALRVGRNTAAIARVRVAGGDVSKVKLQPALLAVEQFRLNSAPAPLKAELLAAIRTRHRRYNADTNDITLTGDPAKRFTLDNAKNGLNTDQARELVRECLVSAATAMPTARTLAELCASIEVGIGAVVARMPTVPVPAVVEAPAVVAAVAAVAPAVAVDVTAVLTRGLSEAIKKKASYFDHFGHFVRVVNEVWGTSLQQFKAFWVLRALQNAPKHYAGDHSECASFMWFSRCKERSKGPLSQRDRTLGWVDLPLAPSMARVVVMTATIMVNDFTLSDKMRHRAFRTALFGRTSRNESWNHSLRVFSAMYSHLTKRQEEVNATVVSLIWNELTRHKVFGLGTSKLQQPATKGKGKLRKKGQLAPVRQPRPLVMNMHTELYATLFGAQVAWWCKHHNERLRILREKRKAKDARLRAERDDTLAGIANTAELRAMEAVQRSGEGALKQFFRESLGVYTLIPALLRKARAFLYSPPWPLRYPDGATPPVIDLVAAADDDAQDGEADDDGEQASDEENFQEDAEADHHGVDTAGVQAMMTLEVEVEDAMQVDAPLTDGLPGV